MATRAAPAGLPGVTAPAPAPRRVWRALALLAAVLLAAVAPGAAACVTVPPTCAPNCGGAIAEAMRSCSASGGGVVSLLPGVYALNDTGVPPAMPVVAVHDVHNVTLAGAGGAGPTATTLLLHGPRAAFSVSGGSRVGFSGLAIDTHRPMYTYGRCTSVTADNFTIEFNASQYYFAPRAGAAPAAWAWLLEVQAVLEFDAASWRPAESGLDLYATADPLPGTLTGPGAYTVAKRASGLAVGSSYILRHQVYGRNAFSSEGVDTMVFRDVAVYGAPGMGFYFSDCTDIHMGAGTAVRRRPGLPMSTTADASHFEQCSGHVVLDGVHFEGQGDDCINVHGVFHDVRGMSTGAPGPSQAGARRAVTATLGGRPAGGNPPLYVGGRYEFRNRSTWAVEAHAVLTGYRVDGAGGQVADFEFTPAGSEAAVTKFALLAETTRQPTVHIRNTYFGNNRARGALLKTSNVLVENSVFDHNSGPCIQAFPDGCYWFESNGFANWTLRNITFRGCDYGAAAAAADVLVAACAPGLAGGLPLQQGGPVTVGQPFARITIESCVFQQDTPGKAVALWGSDGVVLTNNTVLLLGGGFGGGRRLHRGDAEAQGSSMLSSSLDGFRVLQDKSSVWGWVVDHELAPSSPSSIAVVVDGARVLVGTANASRPDLVPVVTSNPRHGFSVQLPPATTALLQRGNHSIGVFAIRTNGTLTPLHGGPVCANAGRRACQFPTDCRCGAPISGLAPFQISNSLGCDIADNVCYGTSGTAGFACRARCGCLCATSHRFA